jgi:hypothetical protein
MGIECLLGDKSTFTHKPHHDLESILYVILFICTFTKGPDLMRTEFAATNIPFHDWSTTKDLRELGHLKIYHMTSVESSIISKFTPYWDDFVPFVRDLIKTCFCGMPALRNSLTHQNMLEILHRAHSVVQESPEQSEGSVVGSVAQG